MRVPSPSSHRFTERSDWFEMHPAAPGVFHIFEPWYRDDYRCNIYLIQGRDRDVLIDTGLGLSSLRQFLAPISPDPLLVSSHSHYDHIGGNFEFAGRLIHPAEAAIVADPSPDNTYATLLLATEDFHALPWNDFEARNWVVESAPATGTLDEGDVLDFGDRAFTVLHTPGHSWGSLCLWDEVTGVLFCADTVYAGELFDFLPCSDIPTYLQTLRRLRDLPVQVAFPGHGKMLTGEMFRAVIDTYLDSKRTQNA